MHHIRDSSITPEIKRTKKMTALQKGRIRPLLALGNDAPCVGWSGTVCMPHTHTHTELCCALAGSITTCFVPTLGMLGVGNALDNISERTTQYHLPAVVCSTADIKQNGLRLGERRKRALWWELRWDGFWQFMVLFFAVVVGPCA